MSYLFSSAAGEEISGLLAAVLGLSESTVSDHLTQLRKDGLVVSDRRGMNVNATKPFAASGIRMVAATGFEPV